MDKELEELLKNAMEAEERKKLNRAILSKEALLQIIKEEKLEDYGTRVYFAPIAIGENAFIINKTQNSVIEVGERGIVGNERTFKTENEAYWYVLDSLRYIKKCNK